MHRFVVRIVLVIASASAVSGCHWADITGPGYQDEYTNWTEDLRPQKSHVLPHGFDGRSREIERHLGVK